MNRSVRVYTGIKCMCVHAHVCRRCAWIMDSGGTIKPFTTRDQEQVVSDVIEPMASYGLRTICVAYKDYVTGKFIFSRQFHL